MDGWMDGWVGEAPGVREGERVGGRTKNKLRRKENESEKKGPHEAKAVRLWLSAGCLFLACSSELLANCHSRDVRTSYRIHTWYI